MKQVNILTLSFLAILAGASHAEASTVNFGLGTVSTGETGSNSFPGAKTFDYDASGKLAADTEITFTYVTNSVAQGILNATGSLGSGVSQTLVTTSSTGARTTAGALPVIVAANLGAGTATVTIENLAAKTENFAVYFLNDIIKGSSAGYNVNYVVSAVPLPASALLFASGLLAFGGLAYRKSRV